MHLSLTLNFSCRLLHTFFSAFPTTPWHCVPFTSYPYTAIVKPLITCFTFNHIVQGLRHLACTVLGWWQLFGYLCGLNTLIMEIVPSSHSAGNLQSVLAWHTVGRQSWQDPLQRPSQLQKLLQKAHSQLIQLVAELVKIPLGWYVILLWHHRSLPADTALMSWDLQTCCLVFMHDSSLAT